MFLFASLPRVLSGLIPAPRTGQSRAGGTSLRAGDSRVRRTTHGYGRDMDIIKLLTEDHAKVNQLFGRFSRSSKPATQDELAQEIIHELSVHAAVEETFVYPLLRARVEGGGELADRSIEEHQDV